ncbi:hypothetical protein CEPID_06465 [Corynebacterium epidermidicanis]|uniref:Uncharacterized protein n=1 Tax=Corynebacterium epidermidicanis TaxID=1050174 RepID=A0A0G3GWF2_9CORY|nr:hypothetical protein CEPID_06465 [Corynebacterium epidermidicanis]
MWENQPESPNVPIKLFNTPACSGWNPKLQAAPKEQARPFGGTKVSGHCRIYPSIGAHMWGLHPGNSDFGRQDGTRSNTGELIHDCICLLAWDHRADCYPLRVC